MKVKNNETRIGIIILFMVLALILLMGLFGCDKSSQKKDAFIQYPKESNEQYVYRICRQTAQQVTEGLLKDKTTHNPLECQAEAQGVNSKNLLERMKTLYTFCKDSKIKEHSWQNCWDNLIIKK